MSALTAERLRELLAYIPETGFFYWREARRPSIHAGDRAGTLSSKGYDQIRIEGKNYTGHRLAWLYTHGQWPRRMLDHINGDRFDNRLCNLREATQSQNQANRKLRRDSRTGYRGVRWMPRIKKYAASIQIGSFDTPEEAYAAYCWMAEICHGQFAAHLNHGPAALLSAARVLRGLDRTGT